MKALFTLLFGLMFLTEAAYSSCSATIYADSRSFDWDTRDRAQQWCNERGALFNLSQSVINESCFIFPGSRSGQYPNYSFRWNADFVYLIDTFEGRGQWDIFNAFESWAWYRVYQGVEINIRIIFPESCSGSGGY